MSIAENAATATRAALAAVQAAERHVAATSLPAAGAGLKRDAVGARLSDKKAELAAIATARAAGDYSPDHAGLVGIINMDIAGLEGVLVDTDNIATNLVAAHTAAERELAKANTALEQSQAFEKTARLLEHLVALSEAAEAAIGKLSVHVAKLNASNLSDVMVEIMALVKGQQVAMAGTVGMVPNIRRQYDLLVPMWNGHPGFEDVPRILRNQLRMQ